MNQPEEAPTLTSREATAMRASFCTYDHLIHADISPLKLRLEIKKHMLTHGIRVKKPLLEAMARDILHWRATCKKSKNACNPPGCDKFVQSVRYGLKRFQGTAQGDALIDETAARLRRERTLHGTVVA